MIKLITNKWIHVVFMLLILIGALSFSGLSDDLRNNHIRKKFQYMVFDKYNHLYRREPTNQVTIVDIDENSLRQIGQWPWPRDVLASLITELKDMGAKVVAFDMVFAEEDRTSPFRIAERLPDEEKYEIAQSLMKELPDNDQIFADAIKATGNIVTGFTAARPNETRRIPNQPVPITYLFKDKKYLFDNSYKRTGVATNLPVFSGAAGNGHFMVEPELDGIIRQVPLFARYDPPQFDSNQIFFYPLLSLEALRVSIDPNARIVVKQRKNPGKFESKYEASIGKNIKVPLDADTKFWVHYRKINKDKEYVPAHFILDKNLRQSVESKIKDKIVFVGSSAEGLRDIRSTPLNRFVAGVEVHVNIVEQILQERFVRRPSFSFDAEALFLISAGITIITLAILTHTVWVGIFTLLSVGFALFASWRAYVEHGLLFDPVYPGVVLVCLFVISSLFNYLRSEVDKRQVKTAFGHYISPVFMEELAKDPDKLKLGGEVKDLTVMFTDIRNFTSISEKLDPEELIQLMNNFLTPMSDLVMESRGTIDKYMGDAMMAFWNAPLDDPDHARQACIAALKMNEALLPLNEQLEKKANEKNEKPLFLSAGIGINTGPCSVGNMGSKQRFAYSALGDTVNLASRLEGQTKIYGVNTLVGEDTQKLIPELAMLELDLIQVVGRKAPVKIFTLIGDIKIKESSNFQKWQVAHNAMLAAYRAADFSCAAQDCKEASNLASRQLKGYYELYGQRIIELTKNPPPEDWDGVYVATSK